MNKFKYGTNLQKKNKKKKRTPDAHLVFTTYERHSVGISQTVFKLRYVIRKCHEA